MGTYSYDADHSDHQIYIPLKPNESCFAKFNAC